MQQSNNLVLKYNALIIIVFTIMNNMTIKQLVVAGYSSSSVLIYRSVITFLITAVLALKSGDKLLPKNIRQQGIFMLNAGISLFFLFQSYTYLRAATVSMVQRLDIPAAVLIGFFTGKRKKDFKVLFSLIAFCIVLSAILLSGQISEPPQGIALAMLAIIMTSYSYILIKRSTGEENNLVIVNTVNIGCILVGIISGIAYGNLSVIRLGDLWIFALASLSQFALNYSMAVLYKHHDVERGRRPYLVAALIVLVLEQVWLGELFDITHTAIIVLVIAVIYVITLKELPFSKYRKRQGDEGEEFSEFN